MSGVSVLGAVVGEGQFGHVFIPGLLGPRGALGYHGLYDPVGPLHGVSPGCIRRSRLVFDVLCREEVFELVACKLAPVVGDYDFPSAVS